MTEPSDIRELEAVLGHRFQRPELLLEALTHSSHAHEGAEAGKTLPHNERMEFLGDAVLSMLTSAALLERHPEASEGRLSKLRAHLVSARHLLRVAKACDLGRYLQLGRGEEKSGGRHKAALLANALEAVIAAIYLDDGLEAARVFVVNSIVSPGLERLDAGSTGDYKSELQEWLQAKGSGKPVYVVAHEEGPAHSKIFTVELRVAAPESNSYVTRAQGPSKKQAEQLAARQALEHLRASEAGKAQLGRAG